MVATRRSATRVGDPPPLPNPPPPPKRMRKKKPKPAAEEDDVAELQATDFDNVTMTDVAVADVVHVTSGSGGKASSSSKSEGASKRKLDVSESEAEGASEAPTGDIRSDDDDLMSELSSLDDPGPTVVELTPKPPKKRPRQASPSGAPVKLGKPMVNATRRSGASSGKASGSGPAGASQGFTMDQDDLAAWMGVPSGTVTVKVVTRATTTSGSARGHDVRNSSSKAHSTAPPSTSDRPARALPSGNTASVPSKEVARASRHVDALPPRTKAAPPPVHAKPPKPSQTETRKTKTKTKGRQPTKTAVAMSDDEEPERVAALSSPPKGGARPTNTHVIKIKEEPTSPRPEKLSINVVEPTPRKNDHRSNKQLDNKRSRGHKGKQKAASESEDECSSDVEIIEDARQTLKPSGSQESRSQSRSRSRSQSASRSKTWRLEDIPEAARSRWKLEVLPILLRFQGARRDPWTFLDSRSVQAMQQIWDFVYGDEVSHEVTAGDCVHGFANQCLSNWRSAIRAASENVVGTFFDGNAMTRTLEGRATFSGKILEGKRFLYENPFDLENKRLFRSVFFLTVLGCHQDATKNAPEVTGLFDKTIHPDRPIGAFGLAAAAVERVFKLFNSQLMRPPIDKNGKPGTTGIWRVIPQMNPVTGVTSKSQTRFCEQRYSPRTTFFMNCADKMAERRFKGVLAAVQEYMGPRRIVQDALARATAPEAEDDEELLTDGDSD